MVIIKLIKYILSFFHFNETKGTINPIITNEVISTIKPSKNNQNNIKVNDDKKALNHPNNIDDIQRIINRMRNNTNNKSNKNNLSDDVNKLISGAHNIPPRWL